VNNPGIIPTYTLLPKKKGNPKSRASFEGLAPPSPPKSLNAALPLANNVSAFMMLNVIVPEVLFAPEKVTVNGTVLGGQ
jgi:hypothetical protein